MMICVLYNKAFAADAKSRAAEKRRYASSRAQEEKMLLPIVETLNEKAEIVPAIKLKHRNGQIFLKPLYQLAPYWYGGGNTDITMALWKENPGIDEDTREFFNTKELHRVQQDELAFFMGVHREVIRV